MSNLVVQNSASPNSDAIQWSVSEIQIIKEAILDKSATDAELMLFSKICLATGLNPFAKQIYGIRRKGKMTFQCSIDGYRLIADRTGNYAGNDDPLFDEGLKLYEHLTSDRKLPTVATVTVWKICGGVRCNFTASASWQEYAQSFNGKLGENWEKMPHLMLSKCAESLALRKAFPAELSSLRTAEEMGQADNVQISAVEVEKPTILNSTLSVAQRPLPKISVPASKPVANPAATSAVADTLHRLKWSDFQIQNCLVVNFNKIYPTELNDEQLLDFIDYLEVFEKTSAEIKRLKWTKEYGQAVLKMQFGQESRSNLSFKQLVEFLELLKTQQPA